MPTGEDKYLNKPALDIISAASRDLKAPLSLIAGLSELMSENKISPEKYELYVTRILSSAQQMQRTIETIDSLNDLISQQQELSLEPVNLNEVMGEVSAQLAPKAKDYDHKVIIQHATRQPLVLTNKTIMLSAVYNLLDNAIVYSQPSSEISMRPTRASRKGYTRLTIRDKTLGVRKSDLGRIMKSLGQTDVPNPAHPGSSGLGLFATVRLIESINGYVGLKPVQGGSSFFIEIPIADQLYLELPSR